MTTPHATKQCNKCGVVKSIDCFHAEKLGKNGLRSWCKPCKIAADVARSKTPEGRSRSKAWYQSEKGQNYYDLYRARPETRKKSRRSTKAWEDANPDKVEARGKRRLNAVRAAPGGGFFKNRLDYQPRVLEFKGMCAYCLVNPYTEMDHATPLSRGGTNFPENVWPACRACNRGVGGKHAKILYTEWIPPKDRHLVRPHIIALILALGS